MKKKLFKGMSCIALSAVMMCGAAVAFTGCGDNTNDPNNPNNPDAPGPGSGSTISVSMFCDDGDVDLNRENCIAWAKDFTRRMRENGTFTDADPDVDVKFSYQPNVNTYFDQLKNQVASKSMPDVFYVSPKYVKAWSSADRILDMSAELATDADTLTDIWEDSLAFYGYSKDEKYTSGDRITYDAEKKKFVTVSDGVEVGIYGLPKDYSNFGLGFNSVFFTPEVRKALTTKKTTQRDGVKGAEYKSATISYNSDPGVVTDEDGNDVPLVRIGVPTFYKPYNFYNYATFDEAYNAGDPMAVAVEKYTNGQGYCVTIPGWPGDTFEDAKADNETANNPWKDVADTEIPPEMRDGEAEYDTKRGYITYTYAEYSALTWIMTYYTNTYDWQGNGRGGCKTNAGLRNVYGNDQYDGVLYLLPWLAGNDAQYLDEKSTTALNPTASGATPGTSTYTMKHRKLNGEMEDVAVQYGVNSEKFIETVGAFHAYGSDWNGNSNNAGDTAEEKSSGWDLFVAGNCVFYGVGTWNAGALNATDREYLRYRLMPEPVSEDFALASYVKTADYDMKGYGSYGANGLQKDSFTGEEIKTNQLARQDQWGARMDSVGYGVSSLVRGTGWREKAAIDLVRWLTITPATQVTLTYSGAQLPNFKTQCNQFYHVSGDFENMVTPENPNFQSTYDLAKKMYAASSNAQTANNTVSAWMTANGGDTPYNTQYQNDPLSSLNSLADAMKILYLVVYTESDRDLSLRMQYGLNATRDSAMYTYDDAWIDMLDPRGKGYLLAYDMQTPYPDGEMSEILDSLKKMADYQSLPITGLGYGTPAWWCLHQAEAAQEELQKAIQEEKNLIG